LFILKKFTKELNQSQERHLPYPSGREELETHNRKEVARANLTLKEEEGEGDYMSKDWKDRARKGRGKGN